MLISAVQQSDFSYTYVFILFHILSHYGLSQDIEYSDGFPGGAGVKNPMKTLGKTPAHVFFRGGLFLVLGIPGLVDHYSSLHLCPHMKFSMQVCVFPLLRGLPVVLDEGSTVI